MVISAAAFNLQWGFKFLLAENFNQGSVHLKGSPGI